MARHKLPILSAAVSAGVSGGLIGGVCIWIYEAVVWVGTQHLLTLSGIPANAIGLVFGKAVQTTLGPVAMILGTVVHFTFAALWGVGFAVIWPALRRRRVEATLAALAWAIIAWVVMHAAISLVSSSHPNYLDPNVVIGGLMSHFVFTVPMALVVKRRLGG
jgi:hypothetical protein